MNIGIAGPSSWPELAPWISSNVSLPPISTFPLIGRLAALLRERGHKITVFTTSTEVSSPQLIQGDQMKVWITPMRQKRAAYNFYANEVAFLSEAMRSSDCEIIHAHWCYEFAKAALQSGAPSLVTAHDSPSLIPSFYRWTRAYLFWLFRGQVGLQVCKRAPNLTCVSPYLKNSILPLISKGRIIKIIPNGVGLMLFQMGEQRLARHSFSASPCITTCLEGFGSRKNPICALRGFAAFRNLYPAATLVMYGQGFGLGGLAHLWAQRHRLDDGVIFKGHTPQSIMHREMCERATVLLHPSLEESFGLGPLEAMALGIPVIGGINSGAIPYLLNHGSAGALVDVQNPLDICDALVALHKDSRKAHELAQAGWDYARAHFTEDLMIDRYLNAYADIVHHCSQ
jgi:glycosyltransferase involved in cell wall biosynthesis